MQGVAKRIFRSVGLLASTMLITAFSSCLNSAYEGVGNAFDFERTLLYYSTIDRDTDKYNATRFLIEHMTYHFSKGIITGSTDRIEAWKRSVDSTYHTIITIYADADVQADSVRSEQKRRRECQNKDSSIIFTTRSEAIRDADVIDYDFLRSHVDNAIDAWRNSPLAKNLAFEEFKEYILPYTSIRGYSFAQSGADYREAFGKYIELPDTSRTEAGLRDIAAGGIAAYNRTINSLRGLSANMIFEKSPPGIYGLYTNGFHDCVDIAYYGCNALRACGIPAAVEYNICYRYRNGRHYYTAAYYDSENKWRPFNPEGSLPSNEWDSHETANVYRITYAPQHDAPFFLKDSNEYVPPILSNPCIKDVTEYLKDVFPITLTTDKIHNNYKLAYLATFNRPAGGLLPVTWGKIKKTDGTVTFSHAMAQLLYFPIYYEGNEAKSFGRPFYIEIDSGQAKMKYILPDTLSDKTTTLVLTRKFMRKPNMVKAAEGLIGGKILGANKSDFSDAVILYEIQTPPQPTFTDHKLSRIGRYRYYRFQAPDANPHANISEIEWITNGKYGYANTTKATRRHILAPSETAEALDDELSVKLLDAPTWDDMKWKAEYDSNMTTAPGAYPNITLNLAEPQIVTSVRLAPLNADNGIHCGDEYELLYWENGWKAHAKIRADYEYIKFDNVPTGRIYWLRNISNGTEEMPFVMEGKEQRFLYGDIIKGFTE